MKKLLLFISSALFICFTTLQHTNDLKVISNQFNINFPELNCPALPTFSRTVINNKSKQNSENSGSDIDLYWYQKAMDQIEKEEYNISYSEELGAYQSPNRANNIRFIYHKDGFTAKTRDTRGKSEDEWEIKLQITNYELQMNEEIVAVENKAHIENENIRIDYTNDKEGMRQDFVIKQKPEGEGKLRLDISADTKLKMIVGADALMFKDEKGIDKMKYSSLKCWDANGRELRAYFEKNELQITNDKLHEEQLQITNDKLQKEQLQITNDKLHEEQLQITNDKLHKEQLQITNDKLHKENTKHAIYDKNICNLTFDICNSFSIVVNDEDAVYPITIDPLSTSPSWTAESNQAGVLFGWSLSTAGDVNGDGYSDVVVGAPFYDNGQTNGRAFIYHGSATGLSATANWTAESDLGATFFSQSVATAGDVNGDGYSDLIVGAESYNNGQYQEGRAFVYYGSALGLSATANWTAESNQESAFFGHSVSTAGDVNGDGYSDVIVGAYAYNNGQSVEGRAFVYHGSSSGLSATANWTAESDQSNASFGWSVTTAGDVNGDGYSDVVIGALYYDNGQSDEGRAFVYHGSASGLSATANWTAESDQASANFGWSVSTGGDVNGDGYSDLIVGARNYDNGQSDEGRAFVYHGSATGLSATANWTAESDQASALFGHSVSTAGDVNGDGYSDVIVGAVVFDNGQSDEGRAFVYHGSASGLSATANWTAESDQANAYFGWSLSTAGDVNGDGYSDVVVGAFIYDNGQSDEGRAFVYHGSASGLSATENWIAESDQESARFGSSVSTAGDVNGDGYSDVVVGAPYYDNGQTDEGRAFVYHGSATGLSATANWTAESDQTDALFGYSVSTAGDVNGDGFSDVVVGAIYYDNGQTSEGRAFVYHGSATGLSAKANWTAESDQESASFGYSVSTVGDVNGDGYSDVVVGAPYYDNGQTDEGRAFVYHGSVSGLSVTANWTAESDQTSASFGWSVSTAGDVNGDGYSDVIIGAQNFDNGQGDEGTVFVYHGSATGLSASANWIAESDQASASFGWSVSTAGDVNGDGYSDVIIGAYWFDNGQYNEGKAFVFQGSATGLSATANWTAESDQANASFGYSVSTAGDVNGDGYSDVVIGAVRYDNGQGDEGRAFVYHGSASGLSVTANWTAESDQESARFGWSVSTAGDVNGDGYSDVIVGAVYYDNGQTDEGKVYVYYGNGGTGLRSTVQQYKPGTSNIISSGGLSGTNGEARLNIFGKSPFGRADGKIVYEYKDNGVKFSGTNITNSTSSSGSGSITDLGTSITGVQLNNDISGLLTNREYKWRSRVQYSLVNNPYQKFGPWKYYVNYVPVPFGSIKAQTVPASVFSYSFKGLIQGFYNSAGNMMVSDTVQITLRTIVSPYPVAGTAKAYVDSSGNGTYNFTGLINNTQYYIQVNHRNSVETWSKTGQTFTGSSMTYDFTTSDMQAYGDNMIQVDVSPVVFAIYNGDVNQDGIIDGGDKLLIENDAANFNTGYLATDLNGDEVIDGSDAVIADNNAANFVSAITP